MLATLIHNNSLTFGRGKLFQCHLLTGKQGQNMLWLLPLGFLSTQRQRKMLRKRREIIPGDKTPAAQIAHTQWKKAHGGRLAWKSTTALTFINALSRRKKNISNSKREKKRTISLSLFNNGLIFIWRWISNYYFLSSFLLDGVHLYFGFSSWQMQTNVIWIANTKTIYITTEKLMPRLGMELHWDRACQRARSPESWVQSSAPTRHPSTLETEAEGLEVQDHFWMHREFEANLGYIRPCL